MGTRREKRQGGSSEGGPLPEGSYAALRDKGSLLHLSEVPLDLALRSTVRRLAALSEDARDAERARIGIAGFRELLHFARRAAVFASRQGSPRRIEEGVAALALLDLERVDVREMILVMAYLDHAGENLGVRESAYAAGIRAANGEVAEALSAFRDRRPEQRRLAEFSVAQVTTPEGPGFVDVHRFDLQRPRLDLPSLLGTLLAALAEEGIEHSSPEVSAPPDSRFFTVADEARLEKLLATRANVAVSDLRLPSGREHGVASFRAFLLELPTPAHASWLAEGASTHRKGWHSAAVAHRYLVALVVARQPSGGKGEQPTPERLQGLATRLADAINLDDAPGS